MNKNNLFNLFITKKLIRNEKKYILFKNFNIYYFNWNNLRKYLYYKKTNILIIAIKVKEIKILLLKEKLKSEKLWKYYKSYFYYIENYKSDI